MSTAAVVHFAPSYGTVLKQQLRLLWLSRMPWFLAGLLLVPVAASAAMILYNGDSLGLLVLHLVPIVGFASGAWGLLIWRDEGPAKRAHQWSLPVDRPAHDLARVMAGAVWLLAMLGPFLSMTILMGLLSPDADAVRNGLPLLLPHYLLSSLTIFLLVAVLSTALNRPAEWLIMGFLALMILSITAALADLRIAERTVRLVMDSPYSIGTALRTGAAGASVRMNRPEYADLSFYYSEWLPVAVAWLAIAIIAVAAAAYVRRAR
ncbi:MAG: hypothetical protein WEF86_12950 [Gemmatimonadota bacterium]